MVQRHYASEKEIASCSTQESCGWSQEEELETRCRREQSQAPRGGGPEIRRGIPETT
jgi:hypothetical protein